MGSCFDAYTFEIQLYTDPIIPEQVYCDLASDDFAYLCRQIAEFLDKANRLRKISAQSHPILDSLSANIPKFSKLLQISRPRFGCRIPRLPK